MPLCSKAEGYNELEIRLECDENDNDENEEKTVITPTITAEIHYVNNILNTYFYELQITAISHASNKDPVRAFAADSITVKHHNSTWVIGFFSDVYESTSQPTNTVNFSIGVFVVSGPISSADVYVDNPKVHLYISGQQDLLDYMIPVNTN